LVRDLLAGVEERGPVETFQILISGYLGSPETASAVIDFIGRAKARNPRLLYLCDPVMGDDGRIYVSEELRGLLCQRLVPLADIITPNQFELEQLAGRALSTVSKKQSGGTAMRWPSLLRQSRCCGRIAFSEATAVPRHAHAAISPRAPAEFSQ
jgi:pyridoxine kinase